MTPVEEHEIVIVGGGIAGVSLAYFLAARGHGDCVVLEREDQPGAHATGRSAAVLVVPDESPVMQELKVLSVPFLSRPPGGFAHNPILDPTGILVLEAGRDAGPRSYGGVRTVELGPDGIRARVPVIGSGEIHGGLLFPDHGALDVHELLTSFLRGARRGGVELRCRTEVTGLEIETDRCTGVRTAGGAIRARWVVDATGAWAGRIAQGTGASRVDFTPRRRCAITYAPPPGVDPRPWPFVKSIVHDVYFKHESGRILFSPMDEDPVAPCDAAPDDVAIAEGIERLERLAPDLVPRAVERLWAGLRTFAPDGVPVVGEDPRLAGLFWLAGQGGCGIVTSPVLGAAAADLIVDGRTDRVDASLLSPARFLASRSGK